MCGITVFIYNWFLLLYIDLSISVDGLPACNSLQLASPWGSSVHFFHLAFVGAFTEVGEPQMVMRVSLSASFQKIVVLFSFVVGSLISCLTLHLFCLAWKTSPTSTEHESEYPTRIGTPYTNRNTVHESEHSMVVFSQKSRLHGW